MNACVPILEQVVLAQKVMAPFATLHSAAGKKSAYGQAIFIFSPGHAGKDGALAPVSLQSRHQKGVRAHGAGVNIFGTVARARAQVWTGQCHPGPPKISDVVWYIRLTETRCQGAHVFCFVVLLSVPMYWN